MTRARQLIEQVVEARVTKKKVYALASSFGGTPMFVQSHDTTFYWPASDRSKAEACAKAARDQLDLVVYATKETWDDYKDVGRTPPAKAGYLLNMEYDTF